MIKELTKEELNKTFFDLSYEGFLFHYNHRKDIFTMKTYDEIKEYILGTIDNGVKVLGCFENDELVGYLSFEIRQRTTKYLYIHEFYVHESKRKKGYGTALMNEVKEIADRDKLQRIEFNCYSFNENAIKFYKKLGYTEQRYIFEMINED